ncbi:hypothetical protein A9R05_24565 [Burkholderia sp. KK1]|nr:hypothetical protein A9R05_24565 [Burkholderia sp. KK1]
MQAPGNAMSLAAVKHVAVASLVRDCEGAPVQLKAGNIPLGWSGDLLFEVISVQRRVRLPPAQSIDIVQIAL